MATRKTITQPPIEVRKFTIQEIDAGIRKLRRRIEEVNGLSGSEIGYRDAKVTMAESNIREMIREVFGQNSPEFYDHQHHTIWDGGYNMYDDEYESQRKFLAGIPQTVGILEGLIARLEEKRADLTEFPHKNSPSSAIEHSLTRKVFVVHGHDEESKQTVARYDMGYTKDNHDQIRPRARQNVILELGYFVGRLSRSKVCALYKGTVEMPSDFHGVIYLPMDDAGGWKLKVASELKQAGIDVDLNLAI